MATDTTISIKNPLRRDGTSQGQRYPEALDPGFVSIDERSFEEMSHFAWKLSGEINYYDISNELKGQWKEFFQKDPTIILALQSIIDPSSYQDYFLELYNKTIAEASASDTKINDNLSAMINFMVGQPDGNGFLPIARLLDLWFRNMPAGITFQEDLEGRISGELRVMIQGFYDLHKEVAFMRSAATPLSPIPTVLFPPLDAGIYSSYSDVWKLGDVHEPWYTPTSGYYIGATHAEAVVQVANRIRWTFDFFYNALVTFLGKNKSYLAESLELIRDHGPSMTLFITFLKLFQHVQEHGNTLTKRHLDFYYHDVLRLMEKEGTPDQVHILFSLQKNLDRYKIPEGSLLNAGIDNQGNDLVYRTDREVVINQASVVELKTVHGDREVEIDPVTGLETIRIRKIYKAPIANSADGIGKEIEGEAPSWFSFGETQHGKLPDERTMIDANIGFAIASPILLLREGKREITLSARFDADPVLTPDPVEVGKREIMVRESLRLHFSGEKGWIEKLADSVSFEFATSEIIIKVTLSEEEGQVIAYDPEVHGDNYDTEWPMVVARFLNDGIDLFSYSFGLIYNGLVPTTGVNYIAENGVINRQEFDPFGILIPAASYTFDSFDDFINDSVDEFDPGTGYGIGAEVSYQGKMYQAQKETWSPEPATDEGDDFWFFIGNALDPASNPPTWTSDIALAVYQVGDRVSHEDKIYIALLNASPFPEDDSSFWSIVDFTINPYTFLPDGVVKNIKIDVDVEGIHNLILQSDLGVLDSGKPFNPFGPSPIPGSRFYIGCDEAFRKKLDSLDIHINWDGLPGINFRDYYWNYNPYLITGVGAAGYPPLTPLDIINSSFRVDLSRLEGKLWQPIGLQNLFQSLAGANPAPDPYRKMVLGSTFIERDPNLESLSQLTPDSQRGFLKLQLQAAIHTGDGDPHNNPGPDFAFGHKQFPLHYTAAVVAQAIGQIPKEPYTPTISGISIDYSSSVEIELLERPSAKIFHSRIDTFFHLHPFGQEEVHPFLLERGEAVRLMPAYPEEGYLYLGLEKLSPPESVSILFQMAEGSGNPDIEAPKVVWSVLSNNDWIDLTSQEVLLDTTNGMLTSGIINFSITKRATNTNSILPSGLHWLRAKLDENSGAINKLVEVRAQAVSATFLDQDNDPEHLRNPLPAETVSNLLINDRNIATVEQPYGSFGGRMKEQDKEFYTRVHERLRHKARSITIWDYERMILSDFPSIYKVKCINHTMLQNVNTEAECICEIAPGHVMVVTIPNLRNKNAVNLFEPRTPQHILKEIDAFLRNYISVFTNLEVRNPKYEQIRVRFDVGFHPEFDPGFYSAQLEGDIQKFLSPWAFDEGEEIIFGGKIHRSQILNFIEERPYVDFVNNFKMDHFIDEDTVFYDVQQASGSTARSILVSSENHQVNPLEPGEYICIGDKVFSGISYWIIKGNFEVGGI